ncbi:MAG: hypothetical protein IH594_14760 [Bacteroidales bacterium]|nr:hypothetical protein [Bacteroidales bacterium]
MKYAVLLTGILGALLFFYSVYAFWVRPEQFKLIAYGFLGLAIVFFILVIIRKIKEEREYRGKVGRRR